MPYSHKMKKWRMKPKMEHYGGEGALRGWLRRWRCPVNEEAKAVKKQKLYEPPQSFLSTKSVSNPKVIKQRKKRLASFSVLGFCLLIFREDTDTARGFWFFSPEKNESARSGVKREA